jgi:hypothetical protein
MSEDRLENTLEAMKNENVSDDELSQAHDRVLEKLSQPGYALCEKFQLQLDDYLESRLNSNHLLLMEDHLSRCPNCRAKLIEMKNGNSVVTMPVRRTSRWTRWGSWAAAAALVFAALYMGRNSIDTALAQGPRATVDSIQGNLYLVPEGILRPGSSIGENQSVRTGPNSHAVLRLADGSRVEINERTEVSVHAAWSGKVVRLQRGDVIVQAAKQHRGYLRVQTRDALASVKGTVFAVSAGLNGSQVSVLEGAVLVAQSGSEVILKPGEQTATNPALIGPINESFSWSLNADNYIAILASLSKIEKQLAAIPSEPMRLQSRLLQYLPPNTVVYGAIPNISGTLGQAMSLVEKQSAENPTFGLWWSSTNGQSMKQLLDRVYTIGHFLGDEVVFAFSLNSSEKGKTVPLILAEVQPGKQQALAAELNTLRNTQGRSPLCYQLTNTLLVVSDSETHLQWLYAHLEQGAETPFTNEILDHYQRGTGWLLGMDISSIIEQSGVSKIGILDSHQLKYLFLEQHEFQGVEENELALTFKGPRMGLASFLANSGSGGAAEYLSRDVIAAASFSTREPRQLFDEMVTRFSPQNLAELAKDEASLGLSFSNDFAASFGTESAIGIESISTSGPVWILAALVNDPAKLDTTIRRLVDGCNIIFANEGRNERILLSQESIDRRTWTTLQFSGAPIKATWTYDRGYLVAAPDRGAAMRAIAVRNSGSSLIWSQAFQQQLPRSAGLHPSGFAWLNTKGSLSTFAGLVPNPAIKQILAERDPILAIFNATREQIRAASRTRISGFIMDLMLMQNLGNASRRTQPANP